MPGSASSTHRPEGLIERLRSAAADGGEAKLKVLRELKNQIIGNRTKKLSYIKLGAVPFVVSILSSASSSADCLLVQCAATIGSFACGVDAGVKAVLDTGAFPHLINLLSHPNEKVVDAGARALKMIYQSKVAPKYDFFEEKNMEFLISLLDKNNENVTGLGASIITHSCETNDEQKILGDAGVLKKLIDLLGGTTSQRDASLESFATIIKENPEVISKFVGPENGRTWGTLIELTKDRYPRTRLLACVCLILIKNAAPSYLQSVGIRTKLILVLLELIDDPGQVGDEAVLTLSSFIADDEGLQKLAFEASTIDKLCDHLQKELLQAKRLQGIFMTLANLCSNLECCRSIILQSPKALNIVTAALTHATADVRVAACICLKNISRSVKYLSAGHFMTEAVIMPLIQLLYDTSTSVQVAALCTISNLVVDFTMHKSLFVQSGGVKQLVQLSKSMDSTVRLNAVWALRNLMFLVDSRCKEGIFMELRALTLTSLVCDPSASVQEQALALVCNLVNGPVDSIEYVFTEDGLLLNAVGRQLWSASKHEVLIQGMYVLCNVASGQEFHKEAVMQQLLPQPQASNEDTQSIMVRMLQSDVAQLRTAAVWTIVNLTIPTGAGALARVVKLRNAGIVSQLKNMVNDPCLDVKLRVRTALGQSMTFGDFST
ncbi:armadillo repeat-containing protein 8 isoform X1 [Cynara cardunculus var. scolymus]|uniref:Armadillo n=1 Tax=Cynara cardunculus var. scolymus TaxID=59895 RepID=A0A118K5N2_CYNCS|nr:armadillo repeat-containing protein 8 isoform X1 [Cynara cardunculus var. scolymus]KVI09390.1 Armadillo [Cynara cardunculus var. scolymus]